VVATSGVNCLQW